VTSLTRLPGALLRPFVELLWAMDEPSSPPGPRASRELMVPTGTAHIVFRLVDEPLRIFASVDDAKGTSYRHGLLGAPRSGPYVRGLEGPTRSVGAMLRPGVAALLLGAPGHELTEQHICLEDLWGNAARQVEERLGDQASLVAQLDVLERFLLARLPRVRAVHPAVAHGLGRLSAGADVAATVRESGYSHRRFISLFRDAAGFSPKLFARLMRFQRALALLHGRPELGLTQVALAAGYSDQAHLTRECVEFAGVAPGEYRSRAPRDAHHVPLPEVQIPSRPAPSRPPS
jgi:AraC-like DNA-binding protein